MLDKAAPAYYMLQMNMLPWLELFIRFQFQPQNYRKSSIEPQRLYFFKLLEKGDYIGRGDIFEEGEKGALLFQPL